MSNTHATAQHEVVVYGPKAGGTPTTFTATPAEARGKADAIMRKTKGATGATLRNLATGVVVRRSLEGAWW